MKKILLCGALMLAGIPAAYSQKNGQTKPAVRPKPIVFAVLNDGTTLEPIGVIDKGELTAVSGDEPQDLASFVKNYYKPKTTYNFIFGGSVNGTVTIKSNDPQSECGKNLADVTTQTTKAKLKGFVMGLATDEELAKTASGLRRAPTAAERAEIESLVRAEYIKQKVSGSAAKNLISYNLTALDIDNDGKAEMVGSYRVDSSAKESNSLFFIAEIGGNGKYKFGYSDYQKATPKEVMNGDLKTANELGGESLLDTLEYTGDAAAEIFTINRAFEGNNFNVYSRRDGKWRKVFTGYNYHCAY